MRKILTVFLASMILVFSLLPAVCLAAEPKTVVAAYSFTAGDNIGTVLVYAPTGTLDPVNIAWNGLTMSVGMVNGTYGLFLTGTPLEAGSNVFTADGIGDGGVYTLSISVLVTVSASEKLNVTKSPTGETVEEGGDALFIAHCDNNVRIEWRLVNGDGSDCARDEEIQQDPRFRGIKVSGLGTDELYLSNIPASVNGWSVQAKYWDKNGNTVFTKQAPVKVTALQKTESEPSPEPSPEPVAETPAPEVTPEPAAETPAPEPTVVINPQTTEAPQSKPASVIPAAASAQPENTRRSSDGPVSLFVAVTVLVGAALVVATLAYVRIKTGSDKSRDRHER